MQPEVQPEGEAAVEPVPAPAATGASGRGSGDSAGLEGASGVAALLQGSAGEPLSPPSGAQPVAPTSHWAAQEVVPQLAGLSFSRPGRDVEASIHTSGRWVRTRPAVSRVRSHSCF